MVKLLHAETYGANGWNPRPQRTHNPSWGQIEAAIRRLDRFRYPYIWLFLSEEEDDSGDLNNTLQVIGGKGAYYLTLNAGEFDNVTLYFPDAPDEEIEVWESDQGLSASAREVATDVELVLRIVWHFAATGQPLPEAPWAIPEQRPQAMPRQPQQIAKPFPAVGDAVVVRKNVDAGDGGVLYPGTPFRLVEIGGRWCSISRAGRQYSVQRGDVMSVGEALARLMLAIAHDGILRSERVPQMAVDFHTMGILHSVIGEFDAALLDFNRAIELNPGLVPAYNSRAWLLATCVHDAHRNGAQALQDATMACYLTSGSDAIALDTLAAASAEMGNFAKAIEQERKAIELAALRNKPGYVERLSLYEQRMPYRSPNWLP